MAVQIPAGFDLMNEEVIVLRQLAIFDQKKSGGFPHSFPIGDFADPSDRQNQFAPEGANRKSFGFSPSHSPFPIYFASFSSQQRSTDHEKTV
ncbi:MAG: hypothetical protein IJ646_03810 [Clostridia bacterium]|nr:hypothetical protein [Clostridia bacterium]